MTDINTIVLESLGSHLKKHWKKYALGLGAAGLAAGGHSIHKDLKKKNRLKTIGLVSGGLATGAGLSYLHYKSKPQQITNNITNHYHKDTSSNNDSNDSLTDILKSSARKVVKERSEKFMNSVLDTAVGFLKNKISKRQPSSTENV